MAFVLIAFVVGWMVFFNRDLMRRFEWTLRLPLVKLVEPKCRALYRALFHLHNRPILLLTSLGISLLMQGTEIVAVMFIAQALNISVEPVYFFIFMPIIWVVTMIPVSASGLGLREGAFAFFFVQIGVSSSDAVAMSLLYYSLRLVVGAAGGLVLIRFSVTNYLGGLTDQKV